MRPVDESKDTSASVCDKKQCTNGTPSDDEASSPKEPMVQEVHIHTLQVSLSDILDQPTRRHSQQRASKTVESSALEPSQIPNSETEDDEVDLQGESRLSFL